MSFANKTDDSSSCSRKCNCIFQTNLSLIYTQVHLRDIGDSVPDHLNKANIAIKQITQLNFPV